MKKKSVNQSLTKKPVNTLIAARKNRKVNPSVKEKTWLATIGAKCPTRPISTTIARRVCSPCLRFENETEDDEIPYELIYSWLASNSLSEIKSPYGSSVSTTRCETHITSSNCSSGVNRKFIK